MKKTILMLLIAGTTTVTNAQTKKTTLDGYGAGTAEITWINGKPSLALGAYGGVLINHKLLIGAVGQNIFFDQQVNGTKQDFQFNYYGIYSEYRLQPQKNIHASFGLTGAMGWQENDVISPVKTNKRDGDITYVIQPKLGINFKVTRFMQVQAYGSYRFTGNTNSVYYSYSNHNGASAGAALVFGSF